MVSSLGARSTDGADREVVLTETHPLHIIEAGGGSGTCARNILNTLRENHASLYKSPHFSYTIIERAEALSNAQNDMFRQEGHQNVARSVVASISEWNGDQKFLDAPCFIFGLEVLDNMPHDKVLVYPTSEGSGSQDASVMQVHVHQNEKCGRTQVGHAKLSTNEVIPGFTRIGDLGRHLPLRTDFPFVEELRAVSDPIICDYLHMLENYQEGMQQANFQSPPLRTLFSNFVSEVPRMLGLVQEAEPHVVFVPSVCLQSIRNLHEHFPRHRLLLADFAFLPEGDVLHGENGPCVASKNANTQGLVVRSYLMFCL